MLQKWSDLNLDYFVRVLIRPLIRRDENRRNVQQIVEKNILIYCKGLAESTVDDEYIQRVPVH
jgi:hypothetical protein